MSRYSKAFAALGTACGVLAAGLADGALTNQELAATIAAFLGVASVFLIPNKEQ